MGNLTIPPSPGQAAPRLAAALKARVQDFAFESGAVLVQIPQVPPHLVETPIARNRGYFAYPPHGMFYLSAVFRELGIETRIVDLNYAMLREAQAEGADLDAAWRRALDDGLAPFAAPVVCVSFMFDPTYGQLRSVCRHVKDTRPDLCVAVGGVGATADPDRILEESFADIVFSNEGELPLIRFYEYLRGKRDDLPPNVAFRDAGKNIVHTPMVTGGDVDWDIRAEYKKVPLGDYHNVGSLTNFSRMRGIDVPYATVISRRGCRARCTFCSVRNFNGKSVRVRDSFSVVDEMEFLHRKMGISHFNWLDDDLLYDREAALVLFGNIAERLPGITWDANNGLIAAAVTPDLLAAMQASGCIGFTVGLETGNAEILRRIKKPATLERFRAFAKLTKGYPKMFYIVNFILGLPEERFEQALDSFALAIEAKLNWNNFFLFQPLKNTDIYITYAGLDNGMTEEELTRRGTTVNFNPARRGAKADVPMDGGVASGYDVFDIDPKSLPKGEQRNEIWFTFNYIANFLRNPALATDDEDRLRLAIGWFAALGQAYADNPAITCMSYILRRRLGDSPAKDLDGIRTAAAKKFEESGYWRIRDRQFSFSALLDGALPPLDSRAQRFFKE
jgi:radical SAM superfamily enzyme YgiQ (UPF0313 family)